MGVIGAKATFRDVRTWYTRLAILERQICLIEAPTRQGLATGFLVAPDIIMSAYHVVAPFRQSASREIYGRVRFGFSLAPETGEILEGEPVEFEPSGALLAHSEVEDLDVALVRLAMPVGEHAPRGEERPRGWVELLSAVESLEDEAPLAIVQHAQGGPLKLAFNTNSVVGDRSVALGDHEEEEMLVGRGRFLHRTDTQPGSSGAPCFDIDWNFAGLHQGRAMRSRNFNFALSAQDILRWLKTTECWEAATQRPPSHGIFTVAASAKTFGRFEMDPALREAIRRGEGQRLELKVRATVDDGAKPDLAPNIVKSVAAFMNSLDGGTLVIGVGDDGSFEGIAADYRLVNQQRADWDSFQLWLSSKLEATIDTRAAFSFFEITRYEENGRDICVIFVKPSASPVFVRAPGRKGRGAIFYVRAGAKNQPQDGHDLLAYCARRWRNFGTPLEDLEVAEVPSRRRR